MPEQAEQTVKVLPKEYRILLAQIAGSIWTQNFDWHEDTIADYAVNNAKRILTAAGILEQDVPESYFASIKRAKTISTDSSGNTEMIL